MSWESRTADLPEWEPPAPSGAAHVVVAHPDDESLVCSAVVARLLSRGWDVALTCLTAGEGAYPGLALSDAARLAELRRAELVAAWAVVAPGSPVVVEDLPDSGLRDRPDDVADAVRRHAAGADLLVGLWDGDPHPDHAAVGAAVLEVAGSRPVALAPLWARVWFTPAHPLVPWDRCRRVPADGDVRDRRRRALAEHRSQLDGFAGHPPVVAPSSRDAFLGDDLVVVSGGAA